MFNIQIQSELKLAPTLKELQQSIENHGFTVLHIHNIQAILEKNGFKRSAYQIVEFCKAPIANKLLGLDPLAGLFLPCKAVIFEENNKIIVAFLNPDIMENFFDMPEVLDLARKIEDELQKIKDDLKIKLINN